MGLCAAGSLLFLPFLKAGVLLWLACLLHYARRGCLAIPSHHIMCVAAAQLQHEVLSSSLPPLSARTVGKHLPLQWLTNPLDFWLEIAIPPQALPAPNVLWLLTPKAAASLGARVLGAKFCADLAGV